MKEATEKVLRKHRLPTEALDTLLKDMRGAKKKIDAILGHDESNLFRSSMVLERSEDSVRGEYPQTYAVVVHLLHEALKEGAAIDLSSLSMIHNSVNLKGQPSKMSRVLSRQIKGKENVVEYCMKELGIAKVDQFLPKLGDIVKSGRKLFLSTNFLDFITSSANAAFSSCHGPDGCHFNGNLAYARDNMTVITFVGEEKCKITDHEIYKLGRSWLFLKDNMIVQPKSYGAYHDFERDAARKMIEAKMAASLGIENKYLLATNQSISSYDYEDPEDRNDGEGALYFDNYAIDISYHASQTFNKPHLDFAAAKCLVCGVTTDYTEKGTCSEHDGHVKGVCTVCGTRHLIDNMGSHDGVLYCTNCFDELFVYCSHCGRDHLKEETEDIGGQIVCKKCKEERYTTCSCCGKFARKDSLDDLKGIGHVCADCLSKFHLCGNCGEYHKKEEVEYHKYIGRICNGCLEKVAKKCEGCGEYFLVNELSKDGSCKACDARREGKEVTIPTKHKYADLPEGWDDYFEIVG